MMELGIIVQYTHSRGRSRCNYWRMRNYLTGVTWGTAQGRIKSATLPVNPYGVVHRREEATRRLLLGKPNLFRSGQKGGESETRKPFFSGWAPNGDATGDLWTTCRCYGPINSRCRRQQRRRPASHSRSLSPPRLFLFSSGSLVFGHLVT